MSFERALGHPSAGTRAAFTTVSTGPLRRLGLRGRTVTVALTDDALVMTGAEAGALRLPLDRVARMRVGFEEYRTGISRFLRLWPADGSRAVRLLAGDDLPAYGRFVRLAAEAMLHPSRRIVVETGAGYFVPVTVLVVFGGLTLGSAGMIARDLIRGENRTPYVASFVLGAIVLVVLGRWMLARYVPRRIARPDEVARALPGC